ncbi:hypothetical protein ACHAWF_007174 [Thalassiosira exigua]
MMAVSSKGAPQTQKNKSLAPLLRASHFLPSSAASSESVDRIDPPSPLEKLHAMKLSLAAASILASAATRAGAFVVPPSTSSSSVASTSRVPSARSRAVLRPLTMSDGAVMDAETIEEGAETYDDGTIDGGSRGGGRPAAAVFAAERAAGTLISPLAIRSVREPVSPAGAQAGELGRSAGLGLGTRRPARQRVEMAKATGRAAVGAPARARVVVARERPARWLVRRHLRSERRRGTRCGPATQLSKAKRPIDRAGRASLAPAPCTGWQTRATELLQRPAHEARAAAEVEGSAGLAAADEAAVGARRSDRPLGRGSQLGHEPGTRQRSVEFAGRSAGLAPACEQAGILSARASVFQAEVGRVMDIIINSLYSNRDVFLRELASNAADACDKKRFLSITDEDAGGLAEPTIRIKADKDAMTVTIEDSGVGMTKSELQNNLGRIAQSGTKKFMEALGEGNADVNLIGQFGVGFYSAYLVADRVEVVTKSMQPGSDQLKWTSDASSSYTISEDAKGEPIEGSGTRLVLHLKDDALEYLEPSKLEELLQHYSEFVEFPISVWKEKTEYKQVPDDEANETLEEGEEPKTKTVPETTEGYERMNANKPIWLRSPSDVTEEEYKDFYQSAFRASYDEPLAHTHFSLEGQIECKSILYIPGMLPFELSKDMFDEDSRNVRLYVKRVFINDKFEDIVPRWLKFVRGVVDSQDLPLNVSREILQKSKVLSIINKRLVRKSLDMIREIEGDEDESKYIMFWNNFGKYLKVGVIEDARNKDDIVPLLRFSSSSSDEEYTSLDQYVEGMKEGQKLIYYVTADGKEKARLSPAAEKVRNRGYEVLYLTEPLDEIMIESVTRYKDFRLADVSKEGLDLGDEDEEERKKKEEALDEEHKGVKEYLEAALAEKVSKVKMTDLLSESPAALVQSAYGMSPTMQRYMKAQNVASGGSDAGTMGSFNQAVLEVNPSHPIMKDLERMVASRGEGEDLEGEGGDEAKDFATLLYDVAALTSGYEIEETGDFARRILSMMTSKARTDVKDAEVEASNVAQEHVEDNHENV